MDPKGNRPTPCSGRPIRTERPDTLCALSRRNPYVSPHPGEARKWPENLPMCNLEHRNAMRMLCAFLHRQAHTRSP